MDRGLGVPTRSENTAARGDIVEEIARRRRRGPVVALETAATPRAPGAVWVSGEDAFAVVLERGVWSVRGEAPAGTAERVARSTASETPNAEPFGTLEALLTWLEAAHPPRPGGGCGRAVWWALGYFGYECAAPNSVPRGEFPDAWFLLTDRLDVLPTPTRPESRPRLPADEPADAASLFEASDPGLSQYAEVFEALRRELVEGNSYQLCYTYPLHRAPCVDALELFAVLRERNPAPYGAFLDAGDFAVVSSSPERFLRCDAAGNVEARPMKGTIRRTAEPREDRRLRRQLARSEKDRAENLMIADLLRNDLARVCALGSVRVPERAAVEEHATVFQMVSGIEGRLEAGVPRSALLRAAFPPGSMTGAPKVRSVEILRALEGRPRGPYSGILGYWRSDGALDFSVLIRTWVLGRERASLGVGGGVVILSECEAEFEESRLKARAMLEAYQRARGRSS